MIALLLVVIFLPAAVTAGVLLVGCAIRSPAGSSRYVRGLGVLSIATAYVAAHVARHGWTPPASWRQMEAWQLLLWLTCLAAGLAMLNGVPPGRWWRRWVPRVILVLGGVVLSLKPYWQYTWSPGTAVAWIAGLTAGFCMFWLSMEMSAEKIRDGSWTFAIATVSLGTSVVLVLTGSLRLSELGISLTMAMAVIAVAGLRQVFRPLAIGASAVVPVILGGLWLSGHFYSDTGGTTVLWLTLAPAAAWIGHLPPLTRLRPGVLASVRVGAVLAAVLIAVVPLGLERSRDTGRSAKVNDTGASAFSRAPERGTTLSPEAGGRAWTSPLPFTMHLSRLHPVPAAAGSESRDRFHTATSKPGVRSDRRSLIGAHRDTRCVRC